MQTGPSDAFIALKAISLSDDLTGTEKRVAAVIVDHHNRHTGQCDPSLGSIARLLGISRRTVIRAVGVLACGKGYFLQNEGMGSFTGNSYQPVWSRFRANELKWNELRTAARRFRAAEMSPLQGRGCHLDGDADGTQTYSSNSLNKTCLVGRPANKISASNEPNVRKGLSREDYSKVTYRTAEERFHVKPTSSSIAAHDAAGVTLECTADKAVCSSAARRIRKCGRRNRYRPAQSDDGHRAQEARHWIVFLDE